LFRCLVWQDLAQRLQCVKSLVRVWIVWRIFFVEPTFDLGKQWLDAAHLAHDEQNDDRDKKQLSVFLKEI
jgi:hypothetical protein